MAVDDGDVRAAEAAVQRMTPDLWHDGLDDQALTAMRSAVSRGVSDAEEGLRDLEQFRFRSGVARAIVRRLGHELAAQARIETHVHEVARERLALAPPELN